MASKPELTEAQKLRAKQKEARELRRALQGLADQVLDYLDSFDTVMKAKPGPDRDAALARLNNALELANDRVRFGALGVDFRKDDKAAVLRSIRKS